MNKNNNLGRFFLVLTIILWSLYEVYPPKARDLIKAFDNRATHRDATLTNILAQADVLHNTGTNNDFAALQTAIGTNDLLKYFQGIYPAAANQIRPTIYILNRLQRESAGKIKLGIDLQGGTQFLVEMDTSKLASLLEIGRAHI